MATGGFSTSIRRALFGRSPRCTMVSPREGGGCSTWFVPALLTLGILAILIGAFCYEHYKIGGVDYYTYDGLFACYMMVLVTAFVALLMKDYRPLWLPKEEATNVLGLEREEDEDTEDK